MRQASGTTDARPAPTGIAAAPDRLLRYRARPARPKRRQPMSNCCKLASALPLDNRCANRVVTTRRQPVVTTRTLPQRTRGYAGQPQVTAPRDGLTARQNRRPCNAICLSRSPRAMSAMAPPGAPRALGINGSTRWTGLQQQAPSKPMPRAAAASSKTSAQDGSGVPCPS